MTREPCSQSDYQKVLNKAKQKYRDAIRGYAYQKELMFGNIDNLEDYTFLEKRRDIFKAEFTVLEDVFGSSALTEELQKSFYSPSVQEIVDEIDIKMQELKILEDKIGRRLVYEKNN